MRIDTTFQLPFLAFLRRTFAEHIGKETLLQKGASVNEQDYFVSMIESVSDIEVKCISFALKIYFCCFDASLFETRLYGFSPARDREAALNQHGYFIKGMTV